MLLQQRTQRLLLLRRQLRLVPLHERQQALVPQHRQHALVLLEAREVAHQRVDQHVRQRVLLVQQHRHEQRRRALVAIRRLSPTRLRQLRHLHQRRRAVRHRHRHLRQHAAHDHRLAQRAALLAQRQQNPLEEGRRLVHRLLQRLVQMVVQLPASAAPPKPSCASGCRPAQQAAALNGVDATEIFNSVSDEGESSRPYSGDFVDTAACQGLFYPLVADDDTHMYNCDETKAWIMLEAKITDSDEALLQAIKEEKFYATQGPEIHIRRNGDEITVLCSPVSRISFFSNAVWAPERGHRGTGLTQAVCHVQPWEKFIRAEVTDEQGRKAWSKVIRL